jgi:hypothetical protein
VYFCSSATAAGRMGESASLKSRRILMAYLEMVSASIPANLSRLCLDEANRQITNRRGRLDGPYPWSSIRVMNSRG